MLVVVQRHVPMVLSCSRTPWRSHSCRFWDKVPTGELSGSPWRFYNCRSWTKFVLCPSLYQRQVPTVLTVQKPVEIPLLQFTVKVVDIPVVEQRQFPMVQT